MTTTLCNHSNIRTLPQDIRTILILEWCWGCEKNEQGCPVHKPFLIIEHPNIGTRVFLAMAWTAELKQLAEMCPTLRPTQMLHETNALNIGGQVHCDHVY